MSAKGQINFTITGAATESLTSTEPFDLVYIDGSGVTLAGNWVLQMSGTPPRNYVVFIQYEATIVLNGNKITILGENLTDELANGTKCWIAAWYNGSKWIVNIMPDVLQTGYLPTANLVTDFRPLKSYDVVNNNTTATTSKETLQTHTIAGGTLDTDGDAVIIEAAGTTAANANVKTIFLDNNTTGKNFVTNPTTTAANGLDWYIYGKVVRASATTALYFGYMMFEGVAVEGMAYSTDAAVWASDIDFVIAGQNGTASANDIVCQWSTAVVQKIDA